MIKPRKQQPPRKKRSTWSSSVRMKNKEVRRVLGFEFPVFSLSLGVVRFFFVSYRIETQTQKRKKMIRDYEATRVDFSFSSSTRFYRSFPSWTWKKSAHIEKERARESVRGRERASEETTPNIEQGCYWIFA